MSQSRYINNKIRNANGYQYTNFFVNIISVLFCNLFQGIPNAAPYRVPYIAKLLNNNLSSQIFTLPKVFSKGYLFSKMYLENCQEQRKMFFPGKIMYHTHIAAQSLSWKILGHLFGQCWNGEFFLIRTILGQLILSYLDNVPFLEQYPIVGQ